MGFFPFFKYACLCDLSFAAMSFFPRKVLFSVEGKVLVIETECFFLAGRLLIPSKLAGCYTVAFTCNSLMRATLIVRGSAKAKKAKKISAGCRFSDFR